MQILLYSGLNSAFYSMSSYLIKNKCSCDISISIDDFRAKLMLFRYDLCILDYQVVQARGLNILHEIKSLQRTSKILILSENLAREDAEKLYKNGVSQIANNLKSEKELVLLIEALIIGRNIDKNYDLEDLKLDKEKRIVSRSGRVINLRNKEFNLLEYLLQNVGKVISRDQILNEVWDREAQIFTNTVDVHIHSLRKKINEGFNKKLIQTIPCIGYKIG